MEELQKLTTDAPAPASEEKIAQDAREVRKIIHNKRIDNGALDDNARDQDLRAS